MANRERETWLQRHAAGERLLAVPTLRFFRRQVERVVDRLGDHPVPSLVPQAFSVPAEAEAMIEALKDPILTIMGAGAAAVLYSRKPRRRRAVEDFRLPERVIQSISAVFSDMEKLDWWEDLQRGRAESIAEILQDGIAEGLSGPALAKRIRETFSTINKVQSAALVRTTTTSAYGAGHQASFEALAEDGERFKKVWNAVSDNDTREAHDDADNQAVEPNEPFVVDGEELMYPGDFGNGASAGNLINCRCVAIAQWED